jgi:hypothetical protein
MPGNNSFGRPIFLSKTERKEAHALVRIPLQPTGAYDEAWLQQLIHQYPNLLPIEEVEPALIPAIPICTELSVPSGFIDNLYATPRGDLIGN